MSKLIHIEKIHNRQYVAVTDYLTQVTKQNRKVIIEELRRAAEELEAEND